MKAKIIITLAAICAVGDTLAQGIDSVLNCIERNNLELKALKKECEAGCLEIESQNNLEDPSVEYSPFFNKAVGGIASSELVVSQSFDFPTVYAARNKSERLQQEVLTQQYMTARRDILFGAKTLCLDLIMQNRKKKLLEKRGDNAAKLLQTYEKRFKDGNASILEVNKIKMDLMNVRTEMAQAEAERLATLNSLAALNGNSPLPADSMDYPTLPAASDEDLYRNAITTDNDIRTAMASAKASEQDVKLNRQNWIPKLQVGYRRNTDGSDASNGFLVGATFPLFSSRNKMKTAKAQHEGAQLRLDNARIEVENRVKARIQEVQKLKKAKDTYDTALLNQTLDILRKAVEGGEISITDYYVEADNIYRNLEAYMNIERQYQGAVAEIYKNEL